jgi:hypothetical protein
VLSAALTPILTPFNLLDQSFSYMMQTPLDLHSIHHDMSKLQNPWEHFIRRTEESHDAGHEAIQIGRFPIQAPVNETSTALLMLPRKTTKEVIDTFMACGSQRASIPRQRKLLRDFLEVVETSSSVTPPRLTDNYLHSIRLGSNDGDLVLIEDRGICRDCVKALKRGCTKCYVLSEELPVPDLCTRLEEEVSPAKLSTKWQ